MVSRGRAPPKRPPPRRGPGRRGSGHKPSSVTLLPGGWSSVWDVRRRTPRAAYPRLTVAGVVGAGRTSPLIWPCSDWGLPCRRCCQRRGGLLPHPFTLTRRRLRALGRFAFCCPVRRLAAPRRYLAVCPVELGLSSDAEAPATIEPGPRSNITGPSPSPPPASPPPLHPRQPCLRLPEEDLQVGIRRFPLAQHQLVLLGGLGAAAQLLVRRAAEQAHPSDLGPPRIEPTGEELVGVIRAGASRWCRA